MDSDRRSAPAFLAVPAPHKVFSFAQAGEAHAHIEARKNMGKVVLKP